MMLPEVDNFSELLCANTPLLDVRAPVEFSQGAFPTSLNAPLLNDLEREEIGIRYKHEGQEAAVALGAELIQGKVKAQRVAQWANFIEQNPSGVLYCFRGGMRSKITQQWLFDETGLMVPRIKGGYKALRRFLMNETERLAALTQPLILGGRTGAGKTHLIKELSHSIDLEKLANHRGSSIGRQITPQPTQINFENAVAIELMKLHEKGVMDIVFEDESPNVGSLHIPHSIYDQMRAAPCVVLDASLDQRIDITLQEYVVEMTEQYLAQAQECGQSAEAGFDAFSEYIKNSLTRVKRRLGGDRYNDISADMDAALVEQARSGNIELHRAWISRMLGEYYDPMYDYQREKRGRTVKNTAHYKEILKFLHEYQ